jgi:hypothetical protein
MPEIKRTPENHSPIGPGPYLARIVSHLDPKYMGTLQVQLLRDVGNLPNRVGNTIPVKYLSPFYGVTGLEHTGNNPTYNDTQKSYGFWMIPPDVGTTVMVIFVEGDIKQGYWIGCVQDEYMNFMTPGLAATELHNEPGTSKRVVAEFNKKLNEQTQADTTLIKKPTHPFDQVLSRQGLSGDETRGTTTSSARRDLPSMVFGISTPGPIDRQIGAKKGNIGFYESKVSGAFVSRLGGSTFVMDDGDENFLRVGSAADSPSQYVSVENDETGGDPTIPHNELVRIRTRTGHQILLHNSEDLIYIGNARGTTWIELTSNGKIDIYAKDSVSVHTEADLNVTADRDINLKAGRNVNIKAGEKFHAESGDVWEALSGADTFITTSGTTHINSGGNHLETAAQIHMNGPSAGTATSGPDPKRVPQVEPWSGHENLNPAGHTADITDATSRAKVVNGTVNRTLDTFKKIGK